MAIITAKFNSRCPVCDGYINAGSEVEWTKGQKAKHVSCARGGARPSAPKPPTKRVTPKAPPVDTTGCLYLSRRSRGRDDGYTVGEVMHATKVSGGGGDDGHWFTVVKCERKWKDDDTDEWFTACYARASTPEECAPRMEKLRLATLRKAQILELDRLVKTIENFKGDSSWPAKEEILGTIVLHSGLAGSDQYFITATAVHRCASDYDSGPTMWVSSDPRALELAGLLAKKV